MNRFLPDSAWLLAPVLALAWLSPNHYPPWAAFHAELLAAVALLLLAVVITAKNMLHLRNPPGFWLIILLLTQVCIDGLIGTVPIGGVAWMPGLYLAGLAVALRLGAVWQANADGEAADFVYGAILIAAILSACLQFLQFTGYQTDAFWFNLAPAGLRMDANLAQPNNLASLHLLALVGCSWLWVRKRIRAYFVIVGAAVLFAGLALTGSRTGFLGGVFILTLYPAALCGHAVRRRAMCAAGILGIWYLLLMLFIPMLAEALDGTRTGAPTYTRTVVGDARIGMWRLATDAVIQSPWWGYGWGQIHLAQVAVASQHGSLSAFNSSHNLVLDLALWGGVGTAMLVLGYLAWRLWRIMRMPLTVRHTHTLLGLGVLLLHSMLELPLHYAYFLLPFGLLLGTLEPVANRAGAKCGGKTGAGLALILLAGALWVTATDYLKIERAEKLLRLDSAQSKLGVADSVRLPSLRVLNHYEDFFVLSRLSPSAGLSAKQLRAMEVAVLAVPSDLLIYNMAANHALNGDPESANQWIEILCKTRSETACRSAKADWRMRGYEIPSSDAGR